MSDDETIYIPSPTRKFPSVRACMFRLPLDLHELLYKLSIEYGSSMTSIVVDLLRLHLPKIPRKPRGGSGTI